MTGTHPPSCSKRRHDGALLSVVLTAAALVLLLTQHAAAQIGTGVLTGKVVDTSSGQPLEDVVVTATSAAVQGEQTVVTDASGTFRIPSLPPGDYAIRYEADRFHPFSRDGINLGAGATLRVDAQLLPEELAAKEVTVVATAPTVDVGSARSGVSITEDFTSRVPVASPGGKGGGARSFEQLAEIAPTARNDLYGASLGGTTSVENQYMIDGLSVGDPTFGYNGTPLSIDFIKETNVITGGYLPEYGRGGGGVLEVVTKSGSNDLRGSVFGYWTPWQADPKMPPPQDAIGKTYKIDSVRDIGFDLGGPIIKNKLWFYLGGDISQQSFDIHRQLYSLNVGADGKYLRNKDGLITSQEIAGTGRDYLAEKTNYQYIGKLTWSPTENDRIELTHRGTPSRSGGDGKYSVDYEAGLPTILGTPGAGNPTGRFGTTAWRQVFDGYDTGLKWTHSGLNKRLTFDTIAGWHHQRSADLAVDGSKMGSDQGLSGDPLFTFNRSSPGPHSVAEFETLPDPSVCINPVMGGDPRCRVRSYSWGGPQILTDTKADRYQLREVATFVTSGAGHHIIKAGAEVEYMTVDTKRAYPGGAVYLESSGGGNVTDSRRYGGLTGPDEAYTNAILRYSVSTLSAGAFIQDSWSIMDKITLNAGFRYDTQTMYAEQGKGLALPNQWSPRLGLIFDPSFSGKAKLFANYAIYYQSLPLSIMTRAGSGEPQIVSARRKPACDPLSTPNYPQGCDADANLFGAFTDGAADPNQKWAYQSTGKLAVDPELKPQSSSEFSAGAEYEIVRNGRLSVTYIRRWMNNILEDMSRDEGATFFLGNPNSGIAADFPQAERNYDAGILAFSKIFADNWLAQASYTLSYLRGNWEGLFRAQTGQLDPGTNSDFDLVDLTLNKKGSLAGDRRHELKLFGAYDIPFSRQQHVNVGISYRARSGAPTNYLARHQLYGANEVFLLPRGAGERMPWIHDFDIHVAYAFLQSKNKTVSVTGDVFNLFNLRAVVRRGQTYTLRAVRPITGDAAKNPFRNGPKDIDPELITPSDADPAERARPFEDRDKDPTFGAPLEYQAPIMVRIGIKSTF